MSCLDLGTGPIRWMIVGPIVGLIVGFGVGNRLASAQTKHEPSRKRLESLSASEKRELLAKKDRFDQLSTVEQQSLRVLDEKIENHPDRIELRAVLQRYGEWLATLSATDKLELEELDVDERLSRIRDLRQREQDSRLSKLGLTSHDANAVYQWWTAQTEQHEEFLLKSLAEVDQGARDRMERDPRSRTRMLKVAGWRFLDTLLETVPPENVNQLINQVSQPARETLLKSQSREDQNTTLKRWIRESFRHRMRPRMASESELLAMIQRLPRDERARLEKLPRDDLLKTLRERWESQQMWQRMRSSRRHDRSREGNHRSERRRPRDAGAEHRPRPPADSGPPPPEGRPESPERRDRRRPDGQDRREPRANDARSNATSPPEPTRATTSTDSRP